MVPVSCARASPGSNSITSNRAVVEVVALEGAATAGTFTPATASARSGSSAMTVPIASMPNPSQIQFTSGLTTTWNVAALLLDVEAGQHDVQVLGERRGGSRPRWSAPPRACGRTTSPGTSSPSSLPPWNAVSVAVTICFWPSSVTRSASCRTVKPPTVTCWPGFSSTCSSCLKPSPAKPRNISTMPTWTM